MPAGQMGVTRQLHADQVNQVVMHGRVLREFEFPAEIQVNPVLLISNQILRCQFRNVREVRITANINLAKE